jgi:hypothetical protein
MSSGSEEQPQALLGRRRRRNKNTDKPLVKMALRRLQNEVSPEDAEAIQKVMDDDDAMELLLSYSEDGMNKLEATDPVDTPGRRGGGIIAFIRGLIPLLRELLPLIKEISGMFGT